MDGGGATRVRVRARARARPTDRLRVACVRYVSRVPRRPEFARTGLDVKFFFFSIRFLAFVYTRVVQVEDVGFKKFRSFRPRKNSPDLAAPVDVSVKANVVFFPYRR